LPNWHFTHRRPFVKGKSRAAFVSASPVGRVTEKRELLKGDYDMSIATVTEISATSSEGFEAAVDEGITRANKTLRNVQSAWVKDQNVLSRTATSRATR
jgi:flavin-binding protein dodecin